MPGSIPPATLLDWYRKGCFPMADGRNGPLWLYSPDPRAVLDPDDFHVSRSLRRTVCSGKFSIRVDAAFEYVIRSCADRDETWLSEMLIRSYIALHETGSAHSVEAWRDGRPAGGLYGVAIGGAFFGESMFSTESDSSKTALAALVGIMRERGMTLLDVQFLTPHLAGFGAKLISRAEYLFRLEAALASKASFSG